MVDGGHDSGGHLHKCHRALKIRTRRIVEDAGMRRSHESQLLQMADWCAHAAFQSIQERADLDERFRRQYETKLDRLIFRPFDQEEGRCIRGWTTAQSRFWSEPRKATSPGLPGLVSEWTPCFARCRREAQRAQ